MKTKFLKLAALALLFTAGFYACETEFPPEDTVPKITMTVELDGDRFGFYATGTDTITIDWGDGTVEIHMLQPRDVFYSIEYGPDIRDDNHFYEHTYSEIPTCTITVTGGNITQLEVDRGTIWDNTHWDFKNQTELVSFETLWGAKGYIDFSGCPKLEWLSCGGSQLTGLSVTGCQELVYLSSFGREHQITGLDVSNNTKLTYLSCRGYQLTNLDVSNNVELIHLDCNTSQLTNLDVSKNTKLNFLNCHNSQLTSLDVSNNTKLSELYCSNNQLTSLDVSNNTKLDGGNALLCSNNNLSAEALNRLFETLHSNPSSSRKFVNVSGNPGELECNTGIAEDKGWAVGRTPWFLQN